ncbi:unnamed protein product [Rhizoctonia solani]|uniref:Uncharacterized protein n=1 Tax=Rhizoctonia solani TaxID=456999 RepID=A0A8H3CG61_9AGAM|nr:unnamed protein product [Rhizoctonia solani]
MWAAKPHLTQSPINMSASVTQNVGGFRAPDAAAPPSMGANTGSLQSNNPYRQPSPTPGPAPADVDQYPSHDPPSYEQVTSTAPSPAPRVTDSKSELESRDLVYGGQPVAGPSNGLAPPQVSQRTQPTAPASGSPDLMDQAVAKIKPRDPLDPPPMCFSRVVLAPSPETTYQPLPQPLVIHAKPGKKFLDDAFVTTGTPPLHKHDILAEDWVRLLEDIHIVARLSAGQRITAGILPMTMHVGFTGLFISRAIERGMRRKNVEGVMQLLQIWNERFFKPRRELSIPSLERNPDELGSYIGLEVILCRGDYRVATSSNDKVRLPAPDRPHARPRSMSHASSSSSSSSSSDSEHEPMKRGLPKSERRQMKRERRAERREQRQARREERRERKDERREHRAYRREEKKSKEPYRLVVVSI